MTGNFEGSACSSIAGEMRRGRATAYSSLTMLPDEVVSCILEKASHATLLKLSTVCRAINALVKPVLFQKLDLSMYRLSELSLLYDDLFHALPTGKQGPLHDVHVRTLEYRLAEQNYQPRDIDEGVQILIKILNSLKSVLSLTLDISLFIHNDNDMSLRPAFSRALRRILDSCRLKVQQHELCLDTYAGVTPMDRAKAITASKVDEIFAIYHLHSIASLRMNYLHMAHPPPEMKARLNTGTLRDLWVLGGSDFWVSLDTLTNLRTFTFSWNSSDSPDLASFATVLRIIKASAGSLQKLALQNILGQEPGHLPRSLFPEELAHLLCVEITDNGVGEMSILGNLLAHIKLPNLRTLRLELEDIIDLDCDVSKLLSKLSSVKSIELSEHSMVRMHGSYISGSAYKVLEAQCSERKILLRTVYSSLRCDSASQFECEWARVALLSKSLSLLDLNFHPRALESIQSLSPACLPSVQRVSLSMRGVFDNSLSNHESALETRWGSLLYNLLERLHARMALRLEVTCSVREKSAESTMQAFTKTFKMKLFPNLKEMSGTITAVPGTCPKTVLKEEGYLREACCSAGIDSVALEVVSNKRRLSNIDWRLMLDQQDDLESPENLEPPELLDAAESQTSPSS